MLFWPAQVLLLDTIKSPVIRTNDGIHMITLRIESINIRAKNGIRIRYHYQRIRSILQSLELPFEWSIQHSVHRHRIRTLHTHTIEMTTVLVRCDIT